MQFVCTWNELPFVMSTQYTEQMEQSVTATFGRVSRM